MNEPSKLAVTTVLRFLARLPLMDADEFCDRWHNLDLLPAEQREQAKGRWGYRAKCVRLLTVVLETKESTVDSWGERFQRMPDHYRIALKYADAIRQTLQAAAGTDLLDTYTQQRDENQN